MGGLRIEQGAGDRLLAPEFLLALGVNRSVKTEAGVARNRNSDLVGDVEVMTERRVFRRVWIAGIADGVNVRRAFAVFLIRVKICPG